MKRYFLLAAVALVAAAALAKVTLRPVSHAVSDAAPSPRPEVALQLVIEGTKLTPEIGTVPKDHHVKLSVSNRDARPVTLALAGYEDRLPSHTLAPGQTWEAGFIADRPGNDFAWLLDGSPAGRLNVTGSHLVEGHR